MRVDVETVYSNSLKPFPAQIAQNEKQFVVLLANTYLYSPYVVKSQTTAVSLSTSSIESYSKSPKPVSESDKVVTYGPYEVRQPFTEV